MRICPHCGHQGDAETCPRDGYPTVAADLVSPASAAEGAPPLVGRPFGGRYLVEALVGEGGMGWVFRATHTIMQQTVALKVMRREVARNRDAIKRFFQEARACSRLRHPNTIKVHDFGVSDDGYPYLVMEYLHGAALDHVVAEEGTLAPARAVRVAMQVCKSLHEAHEAGIVHRDLKPSNVFLADIPGEVDYVKVLDFGVAKFTAAAEGEGSGGLTGTGMVVGTPRYMAPEQIRSRPLDGRTDLYALGHLLFEMLSGRPAFRGDSSVELLALQLTEDPPALATILPAGAVPPALAALVDQLLAKTPEKRPPSAEAVLARLQALEGTLAAPAPGTTRAPRPAGVDSASRAPSVRLRSPSLETSGERPAPRRNRAAIGAAVAGVLVAAGLIVALATGRGPADGPTGPPTGPADSGAARATAPGADVRAPARAPRDTPLVASAVPDVVVESVDDVVVAIVDDVAAPTALPATALLAASDAAPDRSVAAAAPDARTPDEVPVGPPALTPPPPPPKTVTLVIASEPTAEVRVGGKRVGKTPHKLRGERGERIEVTLRKRGYASVTETVVLGEAARRSWTLERQPARPAAGDTPKPQGEEPRLDIPVFD